jgi:tetratricopeptide (TPR) repeat protein
MKQVLLLAFVSSFITMVASAQENSMENVKALYSQGVAAFDNKEYDKAIGLYTQAATMAGALEDTDNQSIILHEIGLSYKRKGDLENAKKTLMKSIELVSPIFKPYYTLAQIYYSENNMDEAEHYAAAGFEEFPDEAEMAKILSIIEEDRGALHHSKKEYESAIKYYERAYMHGMQTAQICADIGFCYYSLKNYEQAKVNLLEAKEIDSSISTTIPEFEDVLKAVNYYIGK